MKKINYILIALFLTGILFSSCKKYLTVNPKTQMPQDILFDTEGGFKDALTGVYIQMKSSNTYGGALTQTTIESLVSSWDVVSNTTEQRIGLFNFADAGVQTSFESIWGQQYKTIANVNAILGQIDAKKAVFKTPGLFELIKGECLAIRAYLHLDMLRLFGPIPTATANAPLMPYATVVSATPVEKISYTAFQNALYKDLTDAENLLKDIDPLTKYSLAQVKTPGIVSGFNPGDTFFAYRYLRMNYFAVKSLQARTYLWFNETAKAYECAKTVIDVKNADGTPKFKLGAATDFSNKDYVLTTEHLFGLYDFDMFNKYNNNYAAGILKKGTAETTIKTQLYGNTGTDIRESSMWELVTLTNGSKCYIIKKYQVVANTLVTPATDFKQIPMLRLSELYLIAAETAPYAEGVEYLRTFRTARNIGNLATPANPAALQTEIIKEYRKEFYAEGQAFYQYKRLNVAKGSYLFAPSAATVNYLVPIPKTEAI